MTRRQYGQAKHFFEEVVLTYKGDECLIWPFSRNGKGYGCLRDPKEGHRLRNVHRMACERVHGPAPSPLHDAAHSCGRGHEACVAINHIRWATKAENADDRVEHGTHNRGGKHPLSHVDDDTAKRILSLKGTNPARIIAESFGVSKAVVHGIWSPQRWLHLKVDAHV
ncbi:hypothetical protein AtA6_11190 [Agrobacterium tumefaciens]|nr:hypothetical protein Ach5_14190 [Agrobacterium tumefaciens]AYM67336.1 hypothetical protein AtA6_11190 [Agrobacterium tumefaciens]